MKKYLSSLKGIEEGLSTLIFLVDWILLKKCQFFTHKFMNTRQSQSNTRRFDTKWNETESPGIDTKPVGIYSVIKAAFQISNRMGGSVHAVVLPSATHSSGVHTAVQNGHSNFDCLLSGHDKSRECLWIRFQISGFLNWFVPILVAHFSNDCWEERDLLSSVKPRGTSVGALPAVPLTLALETLWKVHLPHAPSMPSLCSPAQLPPLSILLLLQFYNYLVLLTHPFLGSSVSCPLRSTFPRLIVSLSDWSSFCFLAFTSCLTQPRVSIFSWLFSWAYSVSLAILSIHTHHHHLYQMIPNFEYRAPVCLLKCSVPFPAISFWHLTITCLHLKLLTFLALVFAVHGGNNALPPRFHLESNSNFCPS